MPSLLQHDYKISALFQKIPNFVALLRRDDCQIRVHRYDRAKRLLYSIIGYSYLLIIHEVIRVSILVILLLVEVFISHKAKCSLAIPTFKLFDILFVYISISEVFVIKFAFGL